MRRLLLALALLPSLALAIDTKVCDGVACATTSDIGGGKRGLDVKASNVPAAGQAAMAASLPVVIASNQTPLATSVVPAGGTPWVVGVVGQAAALLEVGAATVGRAYVVTGVIAGSNTSTATSFAVQTGTGSNCGTNTAVVFPAAPSATSARYIAPANTAPPSYYPFNPGIVVATGNAVCIIGLVTNTANVTLFGYYYAP